MTNIKIDVLNLLRTTEIESFTEEHSEALNEAVLDCFGDYDEFRIMVVPYTPQVGYKIDLSTFIGDIPNAEVIKNFLEECCFSILSITAHNNALLLHIQRL